MPKSTPTDSIHGTCSRKPNPMDDAGVAKGRRSGGPPVPRVEEHHAGERGPVRAADERAAHLDRARPEARVAVRRGEGLAGEAAHRVQPADAEAVVEHRRLADDAAPHAHREREHARRAIRAQVGRERCRARIPAADRLRAHASPEPGSRRVAHAPRRARVPRDLGVERGAAPLAHAGRHAGRQLRERKLVAAVHAAQIVPLVCLGGGVRIDRLAASPSSTRHAAPSRRPIHAPT